MLVLSLLSSVIPRSVPDGTDPPALCRGPKCINTGSEALNRAFEHASRQLDSDHLQPVLHESHECFYQYASKPRRSEFFSRIERPPGVAPEVFPRMLAKGGIHPRGVVLDSDFYQLPIKFNASEIRAEMDKLSIGWRTSEKQHAEQGVVSSYLRLTEGAEDLVGAFREVEQRLKRSPRLTGLLGVFESVIGNCGLLRLAPGETVCPARDVAVDLCEG